MSFEKRLNSKKKNYRKKVPFNAKQKNYIKSVVENKIEMAPERKFFDITYGSDAISTTALIYPVLPIPEGVDSGNRIGNQITLINLSYRLLFDIGDATNIFRVVLFQWRESNKLLGGLVPRPGLMFQYSTLNELATHRELMSPYNLAINQGSYKVLMDKHILLDDTNPQFIMEGFINKGFSKNITFENSAGSHCINQIFMMIVSDSNAAIHPTVAGYVRARYTDA